MAEDHKAITDKVMDTVTELVHKKPLSVISVTEGAAGWTALVEVLERKAVPDTQDLIGIYEVTFTKGKALKGYKRKEVRRRADVGSEEEEK